MADGKIEYTISATDQATAVYKKWKAEVETGNKAISGSFVDASGKVQQYGREVNKVTDYVRTQRAEQRQQNFFINEMRDAVSVAGLAVNVFANTLGQGNASIKNLTNGLNAGIVAFQGINAVTGLLPGPWGMALSVIGGVAAALVTVGTESDETKKRLKSLEEQVIAVRINLGELPKTAMLAFKQMQLAEAEETLRRMQNVNPFDFLFGSKGAEILANIRGDKEALKAAQLVVDGLRLTIRGLKDDLKDLGEEVPVPDLIVFAAQSEIALRKQLDILNAQRQSANITSLEYTRLSEQIRTITAQLTDAQTPAKSLATFLMEIDLHKLTSGTADVMRSVKATRQALFGTAANNEILKGQRALYEQMQADMKEHAQAAASFVGNLASVMGQSFSDIFAGNADSAKQFIKRIMIMVIDMVQLALLAAAAMTPLKGILSMGITVPVDTAALIAGTILLQAARAFVSSFHTGGRVPKPGEGMAFAGPSSREFPVLVRGGETFRTEDQEEDVQRKLNGGGGFTLVVTGNNFATKDTFKEIVEKGMQELGITDVTRYFINNRSRIALT